MTLPDRIREKLERFLIAQAAGELSEPEVEHFAALLRESPEARTLYVAHQMLEAQLEHEHLPPLTVPTRVQPSAREASAKNVCPTPDSTRRPAGAIWLLGVVRDIAREPLALVILLLVMIFGGALARNLSRFSPRQPIVRQQPGTPVEKPAAPFVGPPERPIMARLARTFNAVWNQADSPEAGTSLRARQKLALRQGLAEIAFDSGATIILEGPAELEVGNQQAEDRSEKSVTTEAIHIPRSPFRNSCSLTHGKLVARVTGQAHGFTVHTPTMTIVDLGTEFCVSVQPAKDLKPETRHQSPPRTEVHVLRGEVRVTTEPVVVAEVPPSVSESRPPTSVTVKAGEAIVSDPKGNTPRVIHAEATRFVRELPAAGTIAQRSSTHPLKPGDILAITRNTLKLVKIDPKTGEQKALAHGDRDRHGWEWLCVAVDGQGSVLVGADRAGGGTGGSQVLRIDPRDGAVHVLASDGLLSHGRVNGLTVAAEGIYGSLDGAKDEVFRIDPQSGAASTVAPFGSSVWGIATDLGGRDLLVNAYGDAAVVQIRGRTVNTWAQSSQIPGVPWGVAVRPDGRVFVSATSPTQGTIVEVDRATHRVTEIVSLPKEHDWMLGTLAVEPAGRLIVCKYDAESSIYRIDVDARTIEPVASGGHLQRVLGVAVVPDAPATAQEGAR